MNDHAIHMVFSPQSCPLALLDATLTNDRRALTERLLKQIGSDVSRKTASHTLIVGPRGSGKTHLLAFIRKTLEGSAAAASELLIIPLAEEEHGMTMLLDFLIAALRACRHDVRALNPDFGVGGREIALAKAITAFEGVARGKSILIVVENLGSIFAALESGEVDRLRGFFQSHPRVALLASAVELFADSARPDHPFHGFFSIEPLRPLKRKEARAYLAQLAEARGDKDLEAHIRARGAGPRIAAIYDLTGGNHRLLAMLSTFLTVASFDELVGPFVKMVDRELTPYYQHRLDRLSPQQKKILMCIADHHGRALSVREIAQYAFSTSQTVSRQLADLQHGALVHRTKVGKESLYELNEPLLRLVLDIKQGLDRPLPLIVAFLRRWHGLRELRQLAGQAPANVKAYYTTAVEQEISLRDSIAGQRRARRGVAKSRYVTSRDSELREIDEVSDLLSHAHVLESQGQLDQAIAICDEVVQRFSSSGQPELLAQVARALLNKAVTLGDLDRPDEEMAVYDELVRRFGSSDQPGLLSWVALALLNKGQTLGGLKRSEEQVAVYDEVVQRFGSTDQTELLAHVARAIINKGATLGDLSRFEAQMAIYEEILQRFGSSDQPELLENVALALFNKGVVLGNLDRSEEAISAFEEVVRRFGSSVQPELLEPVASALFHKGATLGKLKRSEEETAVYDELVRRFGSSNQPEVLKWVAMALFTMGFNLSELERSEEAIALYDEFVRRFESSNQPGLLKGVAMALCNKGVALGDLKRSEEEMDVYDDVVRRFGSNGQIKLPEQVARALLNKGSTLSELKRTEEAIAVYDEVVRRFGSSDQPALLEPVAGSLAGKASLELENGHLMESLALSERALSIIPYQPEAIEVRIRALFRIGKVTDAFQFLRDYLSKIGTADPLRSKLVTFALEESHGDGGALRELVEINRETREPLSLGLLRWVQDQLPMSEARAKALEKSEEVLTASFGQLPESSLALQVLSAARRHALGDRQALFRLPLEIRRLVVNEPE